MNTLIATHRSATGERGDGLLSLLVAPFTRTQRKSIRQQYEAGCRWFDIRVRLIGSNWRCCSGAWTAQRTALSILHEIDDFDERCYVRLTCDRMLTDVDEWCFQHFIGICQRECPHILWWSPTADPSHESITLVDFL